MFLPGKLGDSWQRSRGLSGELRHLVDRVKDESIWLGCPSFAYILLKGEIAECLETAGAIIGVKEVAEMSTALIVIVIMIPFHGRLLDCVVHPRDVPFC